MSAMKPVLALFRRRWRAVRALPFARRGLSYYRGYNRGDFSTSRCLLSPPMTLFLPPPPPLNRQRGFVFAALVALSFSAADVQAQTTNICSYSDALQDIILAATEADDRCNSVDLTGPGLRVDDTLDIGSAGVFWGTIQADWFDGMTELGGFSLSNYSALRQSHLGDGVFSRMTNLRRLNLSNNRGLEGVSSNIFSGLAKLETLDLSSAWALQSLPSGLFSGLAKLEVLDLSNARRLQSLPSGLFSGLGNLETLNLSDWDLQSLPGGVFSGLTNLRVLRLDGGRNDLRTLPEGVFSGLTNLEEVRLVGNNPGGVFGDFSFEVNFEPSALEEDFTSASVQLVLREGAPRQITAPLSVIGGTLPVESLTLATGSTQSAIVTVTRSAGGGLFRLSQGELELGGSNANYDGFEIVRGPAITVGGIQLRVKVFLEGALE